MTDQEWETLQSVSRCEGCFTGQWPDAELAPLFKLGFVESRYEGPAAIFGLSKIYLTPAGWDAL
jgi:hypothetical protein